MSPSGLVLVNPPFRSRSKNDLKRHVRGAEPPHGQAALAAAVEGDSEHLIARGLRRKAEERGLTPPAVSDFEAIKGRGIQARSNGHAVYVGGPRLLEMLEIALPGALRAFSDQAGAKGQ